MKRHYNCMVKWIKESGFLPIIILLLVTVIIGFAITDHYGISWDESRDITYAVESLRAFYAEPAWHWTFPAGPTGPFSFMLAEIAARVFVFIRPDWILTDGRHFTYFLMFEIGVVSLYVLCRRFSTKQAALIASFFFISQPLLFGHAFINPKDIPFMAFFSASIAIGLAMVDQQIKLQVIALNEDTSVDRQRWWSDIFQTWNCMSAKQKALLILLSVLSMITVLEILVLNRAILPKMLLLVFNAYNNSAWEPINSLFSFIAENAGQIDVSSYMWKVTRAYWFLRVPLSIGIFYTYAIILRRKFREQFHALALRKHLLLVSAGILLGLATSIRIIAPFAGLLVSVYLLVKCGLKGLKPLVTYWGFAAVSCFITRPYFWENPIVRGWNSLVSSGDFNFDGAIFFQGKVYSAYNLPDSYSPILLLRQFTEPLLILVILGVLLIAWKIYKGNLDSPIIIVLVGWFLVPITLVMITKVQPYDNFRQLFFITVPFFVFASVAVDFIIGKLRNKYFVIALVIALMLPGIFGIVVLHPYEYIYYNSLTGGITSADGNAELDYWCTSYREAQVFINKTAPEGSRIAIWGPMDNAKPFAREDLELVRLEKELNPDVADYALICNRFMSLKDFKEFENLLEISRYDISLAVVKLVD